MRKKIYTIHFKRKLYMNIPQALCVQYVDTDRLSVKGENIDPKDIKSLQDKLGQLSSLVTQLTSRVDDVACLAKWSADSIETLSKEPAQTEPQPCAL